MTASKGLWEQGPMAAQHLNFQTQNLAQDDRDTLPFFFRSAGKNKNDNEFGQERIVEESGGDPIGPLLWLPAFEGAGIPQRFTSAWSWLWPSVADTQNQNIRLNRTVDGATPTVTGPNEFSAFPIFGESFSPDLRFAREVPFTPDPKCYPRIPGGRIGIIADASREDQQIPLWLDCDGRLIAPHVAGDFRMGTFVADLNANDEIDPDRCARLQTLTRVVFDPSSSCADFKGENSLALNITESGRGKTHGGLWIDKPTSGAVPPIPSGFLPLPFIPLPQGTVTAASRSLAFFSNFQGGPLIAGPDNDQHKFGIDGDGNPINSGHVALKAFKWFSVIEDGPDKYDGISTYPDFPKPMAPTPAPFSTQVYYEFDPFLEHEVCGVKRDGEYRWRAATFWYLPEDGGRVPPPRPEPPETPEDVPPPPGGLPIPPELPPTPTLPAGPPTIPRMKESLPALPLGFTPMPFAATTLQTAVPALLGRPQMVNASRPELRTNLSPTKKQVSFLDVETPITFRTEAYGKVNREHWGYTQLPVTARFIGGTANGGLVNMPPEIDMADLERARIRTPTPGNGGGEPGFGIGIPFIADYPPNRITLSETYHIAAPLTFWGAGMPRFEDGRIKLGYRWGSNLIGDLGFDCVDKDGVARRVVTLGADCTVRVPVRGHVSGARLAFVSASIVDVGTASEVSEVTDSTGKTVLNWTGTLRADITLSGAGGLDTGAEAADTWYAVHIIGDSTGTNAPAALLSTSATAPTLPGGHDVFRRVGWVRNDSSSDIIDFIEYGEGNDRDIRWLSASTDRVVLSGGAATTPTAIDLSSLVPPTSRLAELSALNDSAKLVNFRVSASGAAVGSSDKQQVFVDSFPTDSSQQVFYDYASAGGDLTLSVRGYHDEV